ncbi:MAG: hypothetical protein JO212_06065 [Acetobacteraceae bacterium]|nr:hypothetical protein [Acetobacteraceae bacterium]
MRSLTIAAIVFGCAFGGALLGIVLHAKLPEHHLDSDSKDVVKLVMGLIATMAALVLSLLIASAKSSYDTQASDLNVIAAKVVQLDRLLGFYGPEAKDSRAMLRQAALATYQRVWSPSGVQIAHFDPSRMRGQAETLYGSIQNLSPNTDAQRFIQEKALQLGADIQQTRLLMLQELGGSVAWPFLAVLIFWIAVLFTGIRSVCTVQCNGDRRRCSSGPSRFPGRFSSFWS